MPLTERIYEAAIAGARPLLRMAAPLHPKLARAVPGWWSAAARLEAWAATSRDARRPLVWLHAPSVGESLMAQAIIAELRRLRPDAQIAFTFFSASAERVAPRVGADVAEYLPFDVARQVRRTLAALRPAAIAFVRTEVWPVLTREAARAGARLALVNAVLPARSTRVTAAARAFLGPAYRRLDAVGAVARADAARFDRLGVPAARIRVTGDARFDQVWARVQRLDQGSELLRLLRAEARGVTIVAGSTWAADEERLVPAVARARTRLVPLRLIVAPHEPTGAHLIALEHRLATYGLRAMRLSRVEEGLSGADVIVIDRVGVLADAYAAAQIAYVGGGFHRAGLHSVIEPAALERPVLFGPRHDNAREAAELIEAGGGRALADAESLAAEIVRLGADDVERQRAGAAAAAYVRSRLGGARANAELIAESLPGA